MNTEQAKSEIFAKNVWLRNVDTLTAWLTTMLTLCQRSQRLRGRVGNSLLRFFASIAIRSVAISLRKSEQFARQKKSKFPTLLRGVGVVVDYADMVLTYSATTRTRCQRSQQPFGQSVSVVNDFADTVKTTQTPSKNFYGFSSHRF